MGLVKQGQELKKKLLEIKLFGRNEKPLVIGWERKPRNLPISSTREDE